MTVRHALNVPALLRGRVIVGQHKSYCCSAGPFEERHRRSVTKVLRPVIWYRFILGLCRFAIWVSILSS